MQLILEFIFALVQAIGWTILALAMWIVLSIPFVFAFTKACADEDTPNEDET